jgi:hypothetical protein
MSIKGLTNRKTSFPEIGQIRKGAKKTENAPGKDLTFFRIEVDEKEVEATVKLKGIYGPEPQEINILLPFNEIERCWDAWLEAYSAGRMIARSDGETYLYKVDTKTGAILCKNSEPVIPYKEGEVVGTWHNRKTNKDEPIVCKPVGRLKVVLPELQRLAYLTVMTTSKHDIANIDDQLRALKEINGGRIAGIPLVLRRRPKKISTPGIGEDGQARRFTKWMLSIEADPEWVKAKLTEVKKLALPGNGLALLPEPENAPIEGEHHDVTDEDDEGADSIPSQPEMDTQGTPEGGKEQQPSAPSENHGAIEEGQFEEKPKQPVLRYQPEQLKARLAEIAATKKDKTIEPTKRGLIAVVLEQALSFTTDPKASRKQLLRFLVAKTSLTEVSDDVALALYTWLAPAKDSGGAWAADAMAAREAVAAFNFCQPQQETIF